MHNIKITAGGGTGRIHVDGQELRYVTSIALQLDPHSMPKVTVELAPRAVDIELTEAQIKIGRLIVDEASERAMLHYLMTKYLRLPVVNAPREPACEDIMSAHGSLEATPTT